VVVPRVGGGGDRGSEEEEVLAHLRRNGVGSLAEVRYVLYETKGELTIVRERGPEVPDP